MRDLLFRIALVLGLLSAVGPFAIDMYLPALPDVAAQLNTTEARAAQTLTSYFIVFGIAQMFYGPMSDAIGRKRPLVIGVVIFLIATIAAARAPSIGWLIAARGLQGLGAATLMVVPRAVIRDVSSGPGAARMMAAVMIVISISPMLAPLTGSLVMTWGSWREIFDVLEEQDGFAWGQSRRDGYVGFVESAALGPLSGLPTHRVAAIRTYAFAEPSIKTKAFGPYSINALVRIEAREGRFAQAAGAGWFIEDHLAPTGWFEDDAAAVAERFLGAPYLWGGRESLGLDCSGLTQQALAACGIAYPRDTDQQQQLGEPLTADQLRRGDLVFWKGHVAMMLDAERIIHANAHHMATAIEPLSQTRARYVAAGVGEPTAYRRP